MKKIIESEFIKEGGNRVEIIVKCSRFNPCVDYKDMEKVEKLINKLGNLMLEQT